MKFIIIFCFILATIPGYGQVEAGEFIAYGPETKYLASLNGSVYQSGSSYLWINTMNGLLRFDGKRYTPFFADYNNPNTVSSSRLSNVIEDKYGTIWIAGFDFGITKYDQRTGKFKKYLVPDEDSILSFGINRIVTDLNENLWAGTGGCGLARFNYEKDSFEFYFPQPSLPTDGSNRKYNNITDIIPDYENRNLLWLGSFHSIYSFDIQTKVFTYYPFSKDRSTEFLITNMEPGTEGKLWITTWDNGLQCFDTKNKKYLKIKTPQKLTTLYDCKLNTDTTLYVAALTNGLYEYNIRKGKWKNITPFIGSSDKDIDIQKVSKTPDAGIFVGGNYYIFQQHPFYKRLKPNIQFRGEPNKIFRFKSGAFDKTENKYWLTTYTNIYNFDKRDKVITPFIKNETNGNDTNQYLTSIIVSPTGTVYVSEYSRGLMCIDKKKKTLIKPKLNIPDSILSSTRFIAADADGNMWLYSPGFVHVLNVKSENLNSFPVIFNEEYSGNRNIGDVLIKISPSGQAWLLAGPGIFIFDKTGCKKHLFKSGSKYRSLNDIFEGVFANNNEFWVSNRKDIEVIDIKTYKVIATYNAINGLPSSYIKALKCDSKGRIWVATPAGIGLFDPVSASWHIFNRFDGLAQDFLENGLFITSDDRILISQKQGVAFYPIDSIYLRVKPIHLRITSLLVNNKPFTDSVLPEYINSLKLKHDQNNITLEFAAMDWQYPFKTSYYYRIDGLKGFDEWTVVEDARLDLAGLSPGKYQVNIKALGSGAVWSNEVQLPIEIRPAIWQTTWFQVLLISGILSGFYLFFRYRLHQIRKLVTMRDQISRDLHDDIGASLSNISILNEMAKRNVRDNTSKANEYLDRSSEDINSISKNLRDIVWSIDPQHDYVDALFNRMRSYASEMLDGKDIACSIYFPQNLHNIKLNMKAKRELYLFFKEAVNNIAKHSKATEAVIRIEQHQGILNLSISDNGTGFDQNKINNGNGLNNMHERAASLGAILQIDSRPSEGTSILLKMKA